jgi:hypothetical protein
MKQQQALRRAAPFIAGAGSFSRGAPQEQYGSGKARDRSLSAP